MASAIAYATLAVIVGSAAYFIWRELSDASDELAEAWGDVPHCPQYSEHGERF